LRRDLDRFVGRRGKCIPEELKQRVREWLVKQRGAGVPLTTLAAEFGVAYDTALRWSNDSGGQALVPVRVITEPLRNGRCGLYRRWASASSTSHKPRKQRQKSGPTEQPSLPIEPELFRAR
jgi:hypothetical protein